MQAVNVIGNVIKIISMTTAIATIYGVDWIAPGICKYANGVWARSRCQAGLQQIGMFFSVVTIIADYVGNVCYIFSP